MNTIQLKKEFTMLFTSEERVNGTTLHFMGGHPNVVWRWITNKLEELEAKHKKELRAAKIEVLKQLYAQRYLTPMQTVVIDAAAVQKMIGSVIKPPENVKNVSNCCGATISIGGDDLEGTHYCICDKCGQACDSVSKS